YAIGLRVDDAEATVRRARALGAEPFAEKRGPDELHIPAIRGVGGGVIYFIDGKSELSNVWEIEFDPVTEDKTPSCRPTRIDDVAQTMSYQARLSSLVLHTASFPIRKVQLVDVVDPGGLARSQVIERDDALATLQLNGAGIGRTLAGDFIAGNFGSWVQHLAF